MIHKYEGDNEMIFISYSSLEKKECDKIIELIKSEGYKVWMAPDEIPAGKDYADVIPDAIRECDAFVVLLSENSQKSKWVPKELDQAITAGKTIVPFHMDDSIYTAAFNFRLSNVQRIEAYGREEEALKELTEVLKKINDGSYDQHQKSIISKVQRKKSRGALVGAIIATVCLLIIIVFVFTNKNSGDTEEKENSKITNSLITSEPTPELTSEPFVEPSQDPGEENPVEPVYSLVVSDGEEYDRKAAYQSALDEYEENKYNKYLAYYMSDIIIAGGVTDLGKQAKMLNVLRGVKGAYSEEIELGLTEDYLTSDSGLCTGDIVYAQCSDCGSIVRVWIAGQADEQGRFCMLGAIWNGDIDVYDGTHVSKMYTKCDECPSDRMKYIGLHINTITHEPVYVEAKKGGVKHFVEDTEGATSIYDRHKAIEAVKNYYKASENNTALMTSRVLKAAGLEAFPEILLTGEVRAILLANHYCEEKEIILDGGYVTEEMGLLTGDMVVAYDDACENYLRWWILGEADEDGRFTAYSPIRDYDTERYDGTDAVILKTQHESCTSNHLRFFSVHMLNDDEQAKRIAEGGEEILEADIFIDDPESEFDHKAAYETAMAEYEDNKHTRWQSYMLSDIVAAGGITEIGQQSKMLNILRGLEGKYAVLIEDISVEDNYYIPDTCGLCSGDMVYAVCRDCGSIVRVWTVGQSDRDGRFALIGTIWDGDIDVYDGKHASKAYTLCDECPSDRMCFNGLHINKVSAS